MEQSFNLTKVKLNEIKTVDMVIERNVKTYL